MNLPQRFSSKLILFTLSILFTSHLYAATDAQLPSKGLTQEQVKQQFGEPKSVGATVGIPPITRWDYDNYTVVFEGKHVIHSFLHKKLMGPRLNPEPKLVPETTQPKAGIEELPKIQEIPDNETSLEEMPEQKDTEEKQVDQSMDEVVVEEVVIEEIAEEEDAAQEVVEEVVVEEAAPPASPETSTEATEADDTQSTPELSDQDNEKKDLNFEETPQEGEFGKWGY